MSTPESEDLDRRAAGRTVPMVFLETVAARPDAVALRWKEGDGWGTLTRREYADRVARVAGALREIGVTRGDRIVLMLKNRPEFHIADSAALFLGATPVSIYNSSAPGQIQYLAGHCRAKVAVVEDAGFLERLLAVRSQIPTLEAVAVVDEPSPPALPTCSPGRLSSRPSPSISPPRPATRNRATWRRSTTHRAPPARRRASYSTTGTSCGHSSRSATPSRWT
ncbi:MAG: AMP-binding protein [Acidimicrobiia bacterium]|nr:AMP-binding protein [Acidimicrobiia bacterium]